MRAPSALAVLLAASTPAFSEIPTVEQTNWRWDEDWSALRDAPPGGSWWRPFKYVPLDADGSIWASFGLDARLRYEGFENNLWGAGPTPDDGYLWRRVMPHADLHVGPFRVFGQLIAADAFSVGAGEGPADATRIDRLQSFADVSTPFGTYATLTLRGGRALMPLGTERLVGVRYGPNVPQAFDGGRATIDVGRFQGEVFAVRPVAARPQDFDDRRSQTERLNGVYTTTRLTDELSLDLYWLDFKNDEASFFRVAGREHRRTFGARAFGASGQWSWNWEAMLQRGGFGGDRIRAWSVASETSYGFPEVSLKPRTYLRANVASGDKDPDDGTLGTFNAMYPKGKYFGELTPLGPYNIMNLQPGVEFDLGRGLTLGVVGTAYWRASRRDGVYDVPGSLLRDGDVTRKRHIGTQGEVLMGWQADQAFSTAVSYSLFEPGAFIRNSGPAEAIHMVGAEVQYRF